MKNRMVCMYLCVCVCVRVRVCVCVLCVHVCVTAVTYAAHHTWPERCPYQATAFARPVDRLLPAAMKAFGLAVGLDHRCEFLLGSCVAGSSAGKLQRVLRG